jgi:hypothetical protein
MNGDRTVTLLPALTPLALIEIVPFGVIQVLTEIGTELFPDEFDIATESVAVVARTSSPENGSSIKR